MTIIWPFYERGGRQEKVITLLHSDAMVKSIRSRIVVIGTWQTQVGILVKLKGRMGRAFPPSLAQDGGLFLCHISLCRNCTNASLYIYQMKEPNDILFAG